MKNNILLIVGVCTLSTVITLSMVSLVSQDKDTQIEKTSIADSTLKNSLANIDESGTDENINQLTKAISQINRTLPVLEKQLSTQQKNNTQRLDKLEKIIEKLASSNGAEVARQDQQQDIANYSPSMMAEKVNEERERAIQKTYQFDEALSFEERDDAWAAEMETSINQASSNELYAGSSFGAATCKSTFCRVEATHRDQESRDKFELIRRELPNSFHLQHLEENSDGSSRSVIYFVREGQEQNNIIFNSLGESS